MDDEYTCPQIADYEDARLFAGLLTVSEYAKLKGISRQAVWSKIKRGILKANRVGSVWLISKNS